MAERKQIKIKAKCKGVIRLLKAPRNVSYEDFYELLINSFGLTNCRLQYNDEEGDSVGLGSQDELQEALKVAEKFSQLKITLITEENPTMNAMTNKPSDLLPSNPNQEPLPPQDEEESGSVPRSPDVLVEPLSTLTINEKPKPKPRPNRRRIGFYTSLCSDLTEVEKVNVTINQGVDKRENDKKFKKDEKKPKKEKHLRGSKYYSALAADIANMNSAEPDESPQERKEMKRKNPARQELVLLESAKKQNVKDGWKQVKKDSNDGSMSDEEPPKWLEKVVSKMSESVSSQVLGVLNNSGLSSVKTARKDNFAYVHEGITCNGCKQTVVGPRYKCGNCPDFDLCEQCEVIEDIHDPSHVFIKLRYPGAGIGRRHGVMIPLLKDIIYKSKDVALAEEQDKRMKEVRKKLKQLARKKREEQVGKKKADKKMKKLQKAGSSNQTENFVCDSYELAFLGDGSYPDGTEVTPRYEFTKCWKIRNTGTIAWNHDTKLMFMYGAMRCLLSNEVGLPHLEPGQEGTVMVTFIAPPDFGEYYSVWRAAYNGKHFGNKMWCKIKVVPGEIKSETEDEIFVDAEDTTPGAPTQVSNEDASTSKPDTLMVNEETRITSAEPDPIFHAYSVQVQPCQESENLAVAESIPISEEARGDMTLPECNELEWDTCAMYDDNAVLVNEDDAQDIEVISNASSDDYCVVPLPACFDPDIPLNSEDYGEAQGPSVERPLSLADEMNDQRPLESQDQEEMLKYEERFEEETQPTGRSEPLPDKTNDAKDEPAPDEVEIRLISIIPERPRSPEVVDSRQRNLPEQKASSPISIERKNPQRGQVTIPNFDVRSTISEPIAPQPPSVERTPLIPGRLPASPPGRAVPVINTQISEPPTRRDDSVSGSYDVEVTSETTNQGQWQAVRSQPPDVVVARQISEEETVTIQPRGAAGPRSSESTTQSTAQFAGTFVAGTLRRAIGTVTDTVTSFMTGKDNATTAVNTPDRNTEQVRFVYVNGPEMTQPPVQGDMTTLMGQLYEMGFFDRQLNERLLKKYNMDVNKVVVELVQENDNDWSQARH